MKNMKKLISMLLVAVMVMAMGICSFAEEAAKTSKLTINTTLGHTYKVYQMLTGDVSGLTTGEDKPNDGVLANVNKGVNNSAADLNTFYAALKDADGNNLTGGELSIAAGKFVTGDPYKTVTGTGKAEEVVVADGYYVVEDCWTANATAPDKTLSRYMVAVVGDTTMSPKNEDAPEIDKDIIDTDANKAIDADLKNDTAAIGDVIEYEVNGKVPHMDGYTYYYYVVKDTMSDGLTLRDENWENKDAENYDAVEKDGFIVTIGDKTLVRDKDYTVKKNGQSFELAIKDLTQYAAEADISIKYFATVNDKAEIGKIPNTNKAKLQYSNNPSQTTEPKKNPDEEEKPEDWFPTTDQPTGETPEVVTKTYVTQLTIVKVDENNQILDGAQFTLSGENLTAVRVSTATTFEEDVNGKYYLLKDGKYTLTAPHGDIYEEDATEEDGIKKDADGNKIVKVASNEAAYASTTIKYAVKTTVAADSTPVADSKVVATLQNGAYTITGINAGEYTLKETKTPTGYNTKSDIEFKITASLDADGNIVWASSNPEVVVGETTGLYEATIQNVKGNLLPSTGGIGTTIFYVAGTILALGAGVVLVAKRRIAR